MNNDLMSVLGGLMDEVAGIFEMMDWAEDEIAKAIKRHPQHRDALYHSFKIVRPRDLGIAMNTEFVYRSHVVELLERVVAGTDTRPPTAAEMVVVCCNTSQQAPMHDAAAGLYFRLWAEAFPDHSHTLAQADELEHYEKLFGSRMDALEGKLRRQLWDPERIPEVECRGMHHGERVDCIFMDPAEMGEFMEPDVLSEAA